MADPIRDIDINIRSISVIKGQELEDSVKSFIEKLLLLPDDRAVHYTDILLPILKKNEELYIIVYGNKARFIKSGLKYEILNNAIRFAESSGQDHLLGNLYLSKCETFKADGLYDSSMIYILKAKENFEKSQLSSEDLVNVYHYIGDLHFAAGLLDLAESYYMRAMNLKGDLKQWKLWRKNVIINNLGLIEKERKNYDKAIAIFSNSFNKIRQPLENRGDSTYFSYINAELSDLYRIIKNKPKQMLHLNAGLIIAEKLELKDDIFAYIINISQTLLEEKKFNEARISIEKIVNQIGYDNLRLDQKLKVAILLTKLFLNEEDYSNATLHFEESLKLTKEHNSLLARKTFINIYSEYKIEQLNSQVEKDRFEKILLILLSISGIIITSLVITHSIILQRKNKLLIRKNLENVASSQINPSNLDDFELKDRQENLCYFSLYEKADIMVKERKLFVDHCLTLIKLAEMMDSNRTYLSKAFSYSKYGNFSNYIKTLRISEAIKIIKTPGENHKFSIEGIARSVGYFSRTAFIQAFKEHTGVTPSVFIRGWEKINDEDKKKHSVE